MTPTAKPPLLFLPHRIPYPPNKGDKLRSYHMLRYLTQHYSVHVGTFIDYLEDWQYVDTLKSLCTSVHVEGIEPRGRKILALRGLLTGEALTIPYYRSTTMQHWVRQTLRQYDISRAVIFSSSMAQYLEDYPDVRTVVDFCDVDSAKWAHYAKEVSFPMSWLYAREGRRLASYERDVAQWARASVLVSDAEAALFKSVAPQFASRVHTVSNGVDAQFFAPDHELQNPYAADRQVLVFTGAMDYLPNIDAVTWFVQNVWPQLQQQYPHMQFYVVGMKPVPEVLALNGQNNIVVTGSVPDVRPYLRYAHVVVAPLRIARGIQNKVLEAMAMAKAVVASRTCAQGLLAKEGVEYRAAETPEEYTAAIGRLLDSSIAQQMGECARARVLADYSWEAHMAKLTQWLENDANRIQSQPL